MCVHVCVRVCSPVFTLLLQNDFSIVYLFIILLLSLVSGDWNLDTFLLCFSIVGAAVQQGRVLRWMSHLLQ